MRVELNEKLKLKLKTLIDQQNEIKNQINELVVTILDSKEIDYNGKNVTLNDDLSIEVIQKIQQGRAEE